MSTYGETLARAVDSRIAASPATQAALAAIPFAQRQDSQLAIVEADQTVWQFVLASSAAANQGQSIAPTDGLGGRWLALQLSNGSASTTPGTIMVDMKGAILAAGTPMAAFSDQATSSPGLTLDNLTSAALRWNDAATQTAVWKYVDLPIDCDTSYPITLKLGMSKSGATAGDVTSWDIAVFAQTNAALEDAGSNLGGTTPALTSAQAQLPALTITELALPVYLPPAPPARLSISVKPTNGTVGTDDAVLNYLRIEYVRKPATARVAIDLVPGILAAGTPMAAWASTSGATSSPGCTLSNSKAVGVEWNNQATQVAVWTSFVLPLDADVSKPMNMVALLSKSGATVGDAMTLAFAAYEQIPGTAEDAGPSWTGTSSAVVGNATAKTVTKVSAGIAPGTFTAAPGVISLSVTPGAIGTDNGKCVGLWLEYQRLASAPNAPTLPVQFTDGWLAAGTPMAAFANNAGASAPGVTLDNSKAVALRWNNFATQTAVWSNAVLPNDLDVTKTITVNVLASKSGATLADATTFTVGVYEQVPGALENAGANLGGVTTALVGNATAKKCSLLTYTIPANSLTAPPGSLSVSIKPTDGTNITDDVVLNGFWFSYAHT